MQQHDWLLDLGKLTPNSESPIAQETARTKTTIPQKKKPNRSPAQVLAQLDFLKNLHPAQVQKILKVCTVGSYDSDQEICGIDTSSDEMYILISGELAVFTKEGTKALGILPVTTVGELGFITNCQRPVGLKATANSKVLRLSRAHFDRLLRSDTDMQVKVYRNIIDILSNRFIKLRELVEGALTNPKSMQEDK